MPQSPLLQLRAAAFAALTCAAAALLSACGTSSSRGHSPRPQTPTAQAQSTGAAVFRNAIKSDGADPHMTYWNGNYHLTYTRGNRITVSRASSLKGVFSAPETQIWPPSGQSEPSSRCCNLWAPELHRLSGPNGTRWYLYWAAGNGDVITGRMHVAESTGDDPMGPYVYKGRLYDPSNDSYAIDGTVFRHSSGQLYFLWSGGSSTSDHLYIASMSNPWTLSSGRVEIARVTQGWETNGLGIVEAPAVLERNGRVFVTYSGSACWTPDYAIGLLTASASGNLLSPSSWSKSSGPVFRRNDAAGVFGPGHNGFFKSPDGKEDWMVYHAVPFSGGACDGSRSARAQRITWNGDGTPNFGQPVSLDRDVTLPSGDANLTPALVAGRTYRLISQQSGYCADVENGSTTPGANVRQWYCNALNPQSWRLVDKGNGYWALVAQNSGQGNPLCLDNAGAAGPEAYKPDVIVWSCTGDTPQNWLISDVGNGHYKLQNQRSQQMLDVDGGGTAPGVDIRQWPNNDLAPQRWRLE